LAGGLNTYLYSNANPVKYIDPLGLNTGVATGVAIGFCIRNPRLCQAAIQTAGAAAGSAICAITGMCNEDASQNEKKPKNCPSGTQDIDKAKKKFGWDKDKLHDIKKGAHGGMGTGKSWTGVAPDGTVGINEGGEWSPQGHWGDLL
jgi:hypothetical protein